MAAEELQIVRLKDSFYRDGFYKALTALAVLLAAIILLILTSIYLFLSKPAPVTFHVDDEWRILPPIALNQPYLATPDLLQWTSDAVQNMFSYDFVNYMDELKDYSQYFTADGWKKFLDMLNTYINYNLVQNNKLFVSASAMGAPFILRQGLLEEKYGWWVQMPINISQINVEKRNDQQLVIQLLVTRVPTLNNINGVGIDDIIVLKGGGEQASANG